MKKIMMSVEDVGNLITEGKSLAIAGDENLLKKLPKGNWIGGTIPYFIAEDGGVFTKEFVYVTELATDNIETTVKVYDENSIKNVYKDAYANGYSIIIIPATSETHLTFALKAPSYENFATTPLIGWISGVDLSDLGKISPKVIDGTNGKLYENAAVVLHVKLPENKFASIDIINIFRQDPTGDKIEFFEDSFSAKDVLINGEKTNFAEYIAKNNIDIKLPLVADFNGAMVNISFQAIDEENQQVNFYAPVFKGIEYRLATNMPNYVESFISEIPQNVQEPVFSCNCILNYLYSELEGKKTANFTGPITFGEIAYQLLNQTMVYLEVKSHD